MSASVAAAGTLQHQHQQQHHQRQVFNWLDDLNLAHLFDKFIDNGYEELDLCMKIGESDLNAIGIQDLRERIALLQAARQLQHEQRSPFSSSSGKSSGTTQPLSSFLKALSPTRRRIPEAVGLSTSSGSSSRPSSRLGGSGSTWGHHQTGPNEEVELQEIRRYHQHHLQQTHSPVASSSSGAHAPSPQSASTALSSFFHQQQLQQNTFNELIQNNRRNGGNGLEHQQSMLLLGRRTVPLHHHSGRDFPPADDIHDAAGGVVEDDDNGDYSECTDFDLILSAQRACSSNINHNNNIHHHHHHHRLAEHQGGGIPPVFVEQCNCDCGLYEQGGSPLSRNNQQTVGDVDEEPFYESVSPQPPPSQHQTPHRQSAKNKHHHHHHPQSHVNYPVPPLPPGTTNLLGLNYTNGGSSSGGVANKVENNSSHNHSIAAGSGIVEDNNTLPSGGASASGGGSASGNGTHSQANFILRSQLRDQIIQDGINFSRIPDELTLRAMAAKYASELSAATSSGTLNVLANTGRSDGSKSTISPTSNWTTQGLPLLEFQQQVLHQLREIWLEERRKLLPNSSGVILMSPNGSVSPPYSHGVGGAANPSSICNAEVSLGAEFQFPSSIPVSADHNLVGGYFSSGSGAQGLFSSQFGGSVNNGGGASSSSSTSVLESPESHQQHLHGHSTSRGTPKHYPGESGNAGQQQRHQYLEPVIITNSPSTSKHHHQIHKYQPPPPISTLSGFKGDASRLTYTPGIYQPSSCLRDKDEIYDYIPPRSTLSSKQRQISPLSKRSGGSRLQSTMSLGTMRHHNHSKYLTSGGNNSHENGTTTNRTLLHQQNQTKDKTYGFFREVSQTSPRRNNHNLSTIRLLRGTSGGTSGPSGRAAAALPSTTIRPTTSSMSSYTISGSCSSSNSNNSNGTSSSNSNNAYGFANFNHIATLTSEIEDYSQSPGGNSGCRTLANLSKLSRRLGLTRFFRPSRQQGHRHQYHHQNPGVDRHHYFTSINDSSYWIDAGGGAIGGTTTLVRPRRLLQSQPLLLTSPDSSATTSSTAELSSPNGCSSQPRVPNTSEGQASSKTSSYHGLASLPSNERIIETINRLKYEELQRRKERIAQEHRMTMEGSKEKGEDANDIVGSGDTGEEVMSKMSKRKLSFFQIIKEIRDSMSQRHGSSRDGPSSVFYVPNDDEPGEGDGEGEREGYTPNTALFRLDSSSSLKIPHAYENIGTSSGSEFGNNGTLEKPSRSSGRNKFGFGSVGNLGESCEDGDQSHAPCSGSGAKVKSARRRGTASEQNLNDGFNLDVEDGERASLGEGDNESENENEFGPQSLFITRNSRGSYNFPSGKEQPRRNRVDGGPHLDRRIIGASSTGSSSSRGTSSNGGAVISGQEISGGGGGNGTNNGWQLDGNSVVAHTSGDTGAHRSSYGSTASRASTSSESFSEIFARNLKRTFKSNQAKAKVMNNDNFSKFICVS